MILSIASYALQQISKFLFVDSNYVSARAYFNVHLNTFCVTLLKNAQF
jgi:hypothetical protein